MCSGKELWKNVFLILFDFAFQIGLDGIKFKPRASSSISEVERACCDWLIKIFFRRVLTRSFRLLKMKGL